MLRYYKRCRGIKVRAELFARFNWGVIVRQSGMWRTATNLKITSIQLETDVVFGTRTGIDERGFFVRVFLSITDAFARLVRFCS